MGKMMKFIVCILIVSIIAIGNPLCLKNESGKTFAATVAPPTPTTMRTPTLRPSPSVHGPTPTPVFITCTGYVYDNSNNQPIAGATVKISGGGWTTNNTGYYSANFGFTSNPPSSLTITVQATSYLSQAITIPFPTTRNISYDFYLVKDPSSPTPTPVPTPSPRPDLVITASGYVYDSATNQPVTGIGVRMDTAGDTTDNSGYYQITHVYDTRPTSVTFSIVDGYHQALFVSEPVPATGNIQKNLYLDPPSPTSPLLTPDPTVVLLGVTGFTNGIYGLSVPLDITPSLNVVSGTIPGVYYYKIGTQVNITAINPSPSPGLEYDVLTFVRWEGAVNSTSPSISFIMDSDKDLKAYYNRVHYTQTPTPTVVITPTPTRVPTRTPTPRQTPTTRPTPTIRTTATPTPTAVPTATTLVTAIPTATPVPVGNIKVQLYNQSTVATSNQIYPNIKLLNTGTSAINLINVKIRYYYTVDGTKSQTFYCDYSSIGSSNVTGTFVTMATPKTGADTYLEIGFTSGAGSLAAGGNVTVQGRFAKSDWSNYTQTNDYSFNTSATTYADWTKVTGYVSGALQWGVEP